MGTILREQNVLPYDAQTKSNVSARDAMENYTTQVYSTAFAITEQFAYSNLKNRVLAAQILTDVAMKKASPISVDQKNTEFANGYILKNPNLVSDELKNESPDLADKLDDAFEDAKTMYDRENVQLPALSKEPSAKSSPVKPQQPQPPTKKYHF